MARFESLVERRIRKSMEEGGFDDLPGKGRPHDLGLNPYEDPEWSLANRVLKNPPAWIEERRAIAGVARGERPIAGRETWLSAGKRRDAESRPG